MSDRSIAHLATEMFKAVLNHPWWLFWLFLKKGNWSWGFQFLLFASYMRITRGYVLVSPRISNLGDGERWRIWQAGLDKTGNERSV